MRGVRWGVCCQRDRPRRRFRTALTCGSTSAEVLSPRCLSQCVELVAAIAALLVHHVVEYRSGKLPPQLFERALVLHSEHLGVAVEDRADLFVLALLDAA